jgi:two-component system response regulator YesN
VSIKSGIGQELLYLICLDELEQAKWESEKLETMTYVQDFFRNHLSLSIAIAISGFVTNFELINELYNDTVRALEYKAVIGYEGVILVEEYKKMIDDTAIYQNTQWIRELKGAVNHGDYALILKIVDNLFIQRLTEDSLPLMVLRIELNECMYSVLDTFSSVITDNDMRQKLVNKIIDLMTLDNIEDMKEKFLDVLYYACDTITMNNESATNNLVLQVRQFINENYADNDLNISFISDQFSKNPNYLSQIYYNQTGQGLLDTIHEVRIQHAKDLLQNSSITLEQVAQEVGFSNTRTFRRVFSKRCGMNPSHYQARYVHRRTPSSIN